MTDCNCNCEYGEQFGTDFCNDGDCWLCDGCDCSCAQEPMYRDQELEDMEEHGEEGGVKLE